MSNNINMLDNMSNKISNTNNLSNNLSDNLSHDSSGSSEKDYKTNYNLLMAKKTEKIVTAIYLISQFMSDRESLKFSLRDKAATLLSTMNQIANQTLDASNFYNAHSISSISKNIFVLYQEGLFVVKEIISFLLVARDVRLISEMNTNIVIDNLKKLEEILSKQQFTFNPDLMKIEGEKKYEDIYENIYLNNNFLLTNNNSAENFSQQNKKSLSQINLLQRTEENNFKNKNHNLDTLSIRHSDSIRQMSDRNLHKTNKFTNNQANKSNKSALIQDRKSNRRDQILALMLKNQEYSISEITNKIPGCSEKTVARELDNLILEKKLKRIGERRWARYSLN